MLTKLQAERALGFLDKCPITGHETRYAMEDLVQALVNIINEPVVDPDETPPEKPDPKK